MIDINEVKILREYKYTSEIYNYTLNYKNIKIVVYQISRVHHALILNCIIYYENCKRSYSFRNHKNIPKKYKDIIRELFDIYESMIIIPNNILNIYKQYKNYPVYNYLKEDI